MTPHEVVERLRADRGDGPAWTELRALLARLAARVTDDPTLREAAAKAVEEKLEEQVLAGDLDPIASPVAYFSKALRWRVVDLVRRRKRQDAAAQRAAVAEAARIVAVSAEPEPPSAETLAVLERAHQKARANRDPWQRDHLDHAWAQILAIHVFGRTLRELVTEELAAAGRGGADPEAVRLGVQRAHKAHERARRDIFEALEQLSARGHLDADSAAEARAAMSSLRRRQVHPPSGVSGAKESADVP